MRGGVVASMVVAALSGMSLQAKDWTDKEKAVLGFSAKNVGLGTTAEELMQYVPDSVLLASESVAGTCRYVFDAGGGRLAEVTLFENRVYEIVLMFLPSSIVDVGGRSVLRGKMSAILGPPEKSSECAQHWLFPDLDRAVAYVTAGTNTAIIVTQPSVRRKVESRRASALDIGFKGSGGAP